MPGRGTIYGSERISLVDPATGVEYLQVTSSPVHSAALYYEHPSFTTDNRTFLFVSQRVAMRGAPWDLYRVDADGMNLAQLTDAEHPLVSPRLAPDRPRIVYGMRRNALVALDIDTFEETEIARCTEAEIPDELAEVHGAVTGDGLHYYAIGQRPSDGTRLVIRFRTDGSEVATFCHGLPAYHLTCSHDGRTLTFTGYWEGVLSAIRCDSDGGNARPWAFQGHAHATWFGRASRFQGTFLPPGRSIISFDLDDREAKPICSGPYFWHSAVTEDGEWIVADTNWPDEGIMLVHVATGRYQALAKPAGAIGHPQETHPHPSFNRDGSKVVFTSNQSGLSQVYLCDVPAYVKEELVTGKLSHRLKFRKG